MLVTARDLIIAALFVAISGTLLMLVATGCIYTNTCSGDESSFLMGFGVLAGLYAAITALSHANVKSVLTAGIAFALVAGGSFVFYH